jgi:ribosomal protein S3
MHLPQAMRTRSLSVAAMFSGKIRGLEIARSLGYDVPDVPPVGSTLRNSQIKPGEITLKHSQ